MSAHPPPYVILQGSQHGRPVPYHYNAAPYHPSQRKTLYVGYFFRFICCIFCCIFLVFFSIGITAFFFFAIYKPKLPAYKVTDFEVKTFDIQPDFSVNADFQVTIRSENPNKGIGFTYERDSQVNVTYSGTNICTGKLPNFHQGQRNVTFIKVDLHGKIESGSSLLQAAAQNKNNEGIPLLVGVNAPVKIMVGTFRVTNIIVSLNSTLLVDGLAPKKKINVRSNTTFEYDWAD